MPFIRFFLGFLLCILFNIGNAQTELDSLKNALRYSKEKPYVLSLIGMKFFQRESYDSALYYYRQSLKQEKDSVNKAFTLSTMATAFGSIGYMDSSIVYYTQSLESFNALKDTAKSVAIETNLSFIYKNLGLYEKALEYAFNALTKLERQKPDRPLASCYNTIAFVYGNIGDFDRAIEYHYRALAIRQMIGYQKGVGQSYNNLGETFILLNKNDSALANLTKALEIKRHLGEQAQATLSNLGELYLKLGKLKEANDYFNSSLTIRQEINDRAGQAIVLNNLAMLELARGDLEKAEDFLNSAGLLAKETGSLEQLRRNLKLKVEVFEHKKDFVKALRYSKELLIVRDSLLNKDKAQSLQAMQTRYESEKKEQQIVLLGRQRELQDVQISASNTRIQWLYATAFFLIIIAGLVFNQYRISSASKKRVDLLLKELNHRVKNNLQLLSSILTLQSEFFTDEKAVRAAKSNEGRVNAMALIHKKFMTQDDNQLVNLKEYISELVEYLKMSYGYMDKSLELDLKVADIQIDPDTAIPMGLILNELVSNAFKYAYVSEPHPQLGILVTVEGGKNMLMNVKDNGVGMPANQEASESFGLKMISMLTRQLDGRLSRTEGKGTDVSIVFPL